MATVCERLEWPGGVGFCWTSVSVGYTAVNDCLMDVEGESGDRMKNVDILSVSMGAFDIGPAAPATRPQRAVWILGRSWPS